MTGTYKKTIYAPQELAEWIEQSADESERSESMFLQIILEAARDSEDDKVVDIHEYEVVLKEK